MACDVGGLVRRPHRYVCDIHVESGRIGDHRGNWKKYGGPSMSADESETVALTRGGRDDADKGAYLGDEIICARSGDIDPVVATQKLHEIHDAIAEGAGSFLAAMYKRCTLFIIVFGVIVFILTGSAGNCGPDKDLITPTGASTDGSCWTEGWMTAIAFAIGGFTSILSGYIGMKIAVYSNVRTACCAQRLDVELQLRISGRRCHMLTSSRSRCSGCSSGYTALSLWAILMPATLLTAPL